MIQHYANKETRKRLGDKSLLIYGIRNKWRKVMMDNALDIKQIEVVLDGMMTQIFGEKKVEVG